MNPSTALNDSGCVLVADASTVINIVATGMAQDILGALPHHVVVVRQVPAELELGRARGRAACDVIHQLVTDGIIEIAQLPEESDPHFESLVVGDAASTLDDGEAATIAYAVVRVATALIDERKATRICSQRYPALRVGCTVDVLTHPAVQRRLGTAGLVDAVFKALTDGKMSVLPQHLEWVVGVIGEDRAARCPSLPRTARTR